MEERSSLPKRLSNSTRLRWSSSRTPLTPMEKGSKMPLLRLPACTLSWTSPPLQRRSELLMVSSRPKSNLPNLYELGLLMNICNMYIHFVLFMNLFALFLLVVNCRASH